MPSNASEISEKLTKLLQQTYSLLSSKQQIFPLLPFGEQALLLLEKLLSLSNCLLLLS